LKPRIYFYDVKKPVRAGILGGINADGFLFMERDTSNYEKMKYIVKKQKKSGEKTSVYATDPRGGGYTPRLLRPKRQRREAKEKALKYGMIYA
jgi:hypothetical protein